MLAIPLAIASVDRRRRGRARDGNGRGCRPRCRPTRRRRRSPARREEGKTLTAAKGTWTGTEPITYTYQWRRCDADGGAAPASAVRRRARTSLKAVDAGNTLRVTVTAKNADGTRSATSVPTAVVKAAAAPPPSNGCGKATNGTIEIADVTSPARLVVDQSTGVAEHDHVRHDAP